MSKSDHDEVGYGKPPKEHRFSQENQPRRRRGQVPKSAGQKMLTSIAQALDEKVSFTLKGKLIKARAGDLMIRRFVNHSVGGNFNDQIRFMNFFRACGELDPENIRADIEKSVEEDHAEALETERAKSEERLLLLCEIADLTWALRGRLKAISDSFLGAKLKCSCGSFDDYPGAVEAAQVWLADDDPEDMDDDPECGGIHNQGWAPSASGQPASQAAGTEIAKGEGPPQGGDAEAQEGDDSQPDGPGGDLADGMIGSD